MGEVFGRVLVFLEIGIILTLALSPRWSLMAKEEEASSGHVRGLGGLEGLGAGAQKSSAEESEAHKLYSEIADAFEKNHHASFKDSPFAGSLPLVRQKYGGVACTDGRDSFPALILQIPGKGIVIKPYRDKPLQFFSKRSEKAMSLTRYRNPLAEMRLLQEYDRKVDLRQADLIIEFGEALARAGILDPLPAKGSLTLEDLITVQRGKHLAARREFMKGAGKELVEKIIEVCRLGRSYAEVEVKDRLQNMGTAKLELWRDQRVEILNRIKEREAKIHDLEKNPGDDGLARYTDIESAAYEAIFGKPADEKNVKAPARFLKLTEHRDEGTLFEAKDPQNRVVEKALAFHTEDGSWGVVYSVPETRGDGDGVVEVDGQGSPVLKAFRCW